MKTSIRRVTSSLLTMGMLLGTVSSVAQTASNVGSSFELHSQSEDLQASRQALPYAQRALQQDKVWSFKDLGARFPFNLRGVDSSDSVFFNVRADEVASGGAVTLHYSYSPSLLDDYSHINVLVNDEVVYTIPVTEQGAGRPLTQEVSIPARLLAAHNQLRVQLIGHYTLECEDPLHSSLWANVSNQSTLSLDLQKVALVNDLSILPVPFFDPRDPNRLDVPFVFLGEPTSGTYEASGIVASWLGALADYRGARFTALKNRLPEKGHGIVFTSPEQVGSFIPEVRTTSLPSISMVSNPNDSKGKLLVISGGNAEQLRSAAQALVLGGSILTGPQAEIYEPPQIQARRPYDAPRWLSTERPVQFGELITPERLAVSGYDSPIIRMGLRLPPDLFTWRQSPVDVHLKYRYTVQPGAVNSSLILGVDNQYLKSLPLLGLTQLEGRDASLAAMAPGEMLPMQEHVRVPLYQLLNRSELTYRYMYDYIKEGFCKDALLDNVRGQIDPDSTIDISGRNHYLEMPDLAAFSEMGFPFTRIADLSETAVVLASSPDEQELSTFLVTMGRMGESTGLPATGVRVVDAKASLDLDKDLLIISPASKLPANWQQYLPEYTAQHNRQFGTSDLVYRTSNWVSPNPADRIRDQQSEVAYRSDGRSGLITGFESPFNSGRSVVVLTGTDSEALVDIGDALLKARAGERIEGSAVVIRGDKVRSLLAEKTYAVGSLDIWTRIQWTLYQWWQYAGQWRTLWIPGLLGVIAVGFILSQLLGRRRKQGKT
ncbi:cellulose biosynthesis cyclic di-GMP-binding regulatory protein BcsB [Alcaligenes endophyticus]|uniref:Cyclic di-GMP-binding protein n=1 Tax=Alcaligenes endophyticus TaxID=1929088 RepID=A0ABT8EES7_9BURK|nr:cellulose biosynthesis cyclic di-GMP-binding regulatory protein BcsB [Alcaligenes endophyticus]MCX5592346.1 cellulose biosynthesis cyclic di-GMP-binding regulatory protein BcsB [Alcaligenes endophyticus]MDN4119789.1 cellulose biosynthesis cyclic di-GMP-binding regulatory protein BcsB [Alcaligenes endophyticus]